MISIQNSMWNYSSIGCPTPYLGDDTYVKAIEWLDGPGILEDWGCGTAYAKKFVGQAKYVGVDFSPSKFNDLTHDLRFYKSQADFILMRHVLEHNWNWKRILKNAVESFQQRFALVLFTPFAERTQQIAWHSLINVPDLSFNKKELITLLPKFEEESVGTETIFYVTHS